jgi:hypothetical protein
MFTRLTRSRLLQIWFIGAALAVAAGVAFGPRVAVGTGMLIFAVCIVPPAIVLMMWPRTPALTVAEVLRNVDRSA